MKLAANLSAHRQYQTKTKDGEKPNSPSQQDLTIMNIATHDFVVEYTYYDSDAIKTVELNSPEDSATTVGPPIAIESSPEFNDEVVEVIMDQDSILNDAEDKVVNPIPESVSQAKKKKVESNIEREGLVSILKESINSRNELESRYENDSDRMFLLSLLQDFKKIPESVKMSAKIELSSMWKTLFRSYGTYTVTLSLVILELVIRATTRNITKDILPRKRIVTGDEWGCVGGVT
ncbi:unnamed protein product [Euphydryas editha]|uniref:BESS domain-containing protein n=1 Tax=Euphydryas editha TaxID=104508 RepID=A0AAU9TTB2_EUPED|nr:unnamed protein product [Euphydryas editha]